MSMFNWQASEGVVVSDHVWLYFGITIPLTLIVVLTWTVCSNWNEKRYRKALAKKLYNQKQDEDHQLTCDMTDKHETDN